MRSVAILGPGGVGGLLAAALQRSGAAVTVVAREPTAAAIARDGLSVTSRVLGDFEARPAAVDRLAGPVDALVVATKATGLSAALERVRDLEPRVVLPLLNGLDHLGVLRGRFGSRAVAGTIRVESTRTSAGRIEQTSPFLHIEMASADPSVAALLPELAGLLDAAGVPARILDSEAQTMWSKLVRLNALACATSAFDAPVGEILSDPGRRAALEACVREGAAVARAEGAEVDPAAIIGELDEAHPELRTSMQRDIAAGREPELDAIPGSVLRAAGRHGLGCPEIERLAAIVASRIGAPAPVG